jgi:hypothetical protein
MRRRTGQFTALDNDGRSYTIHIYTYCTREGAKELQMPAGQPVNRRDKGVYEIVTSGVILRSSAPNAP